MRHLSSDDQKRIAQAIDVVDQKSDGEIYVLVSQAASQYREVSIAFAAITALFLPALALALGLTPALIVSWTGGWTAQSAGEHEILYALSAYVVVQAALFALFVYLFSLKSVRDVITPHAIKRARVARMASQHFTTSGMHLKDTQPHVLIFLALAEKRVEIVAAPAIHAIVGNAVWEDARDAIIAGMNSDPTNSLCRAVEIIGAPLIEHFPATAAHPDINAHGVGEI
jgi:putative membrane protein